MAEYHPKMLSPVGLSFSSPNLATVTFADTSPSATPTKVTSPRLALQHTKSEVKLLNRINAMNLDSESVKITTERVPAADDSALNSLEAAFSVQNDDVCASNYYKALSSAPNDENADTTYNYTSTFQEIASPAQNDEIVNTIDEFASRSMEVAASAQDDESMDTTDNLIFNSHEITSSIQNDESMEMNDASTPQEVAQNDESTDTSDSFLDDLYDTTAEAIETPEPPSITSPTIDIPLGIGIPFGTALVDLYISPSKTHFRIHKDLLCKIPYFSRMFNNGNFKESLDQEACFPDDSVETFALFLEWLYTKRCDSISTSKGCAKTDGNGNAGWKEKVEEHIIKLYILGQMMFLPLLQDCAISLLLDHYQQASEYPGLEMMGYIYDNTPDGSGARKFVAETLHSVVKRPYRDPEHRLNLKAVTEFMVGNKEMVLDVFGLSAAVKERDWRNGGVSCSFELRRCLFHCHGKGEEKGCLYK